MKQLSPTTSSRVAEQPLSGPALVALALSATAITALFYLGCLLGLLLIATLLAAELAAAIGLARFGMVRLIAGPIRAQLRLAGLVLNALNLRRGPEYSVTLQPEEAPALHASVRQFAEKLGVPQPDRIVLEMSAGAWIRLHGYGKGRGRCTLGLGYDLLPILSEAELEAVIAHEMAHAKLVQRGYWGWLGNGIGRMGQLAGALVSTVTAAKSRGGRFFTAELLSQGAQLMGRTGSRLFAAYSRQHEFAADRGAAGASAPGALSRALVKLGVAGRKGQELGWRDRLVQLDREQPLSEWVRERLTPRTDEERQELEQRAREDTRRGEFDTHPAMADRLAALPAPPPGEDDSGPALALLRDPDGLAIRLLTELERIANEQQQQASRQLHRRTRRAHRGRKQTPAQGAAFVIMLLGFALGIMSVTALFGGSKEIHDPGTAAGGALGSLAMMAVGALIYARFRFRERIVLPVPAWAQWEAAMSAPLRGGGTAVALPQIEAELKAGPPAPPKAKRARARFWGTEAYRYLQECDYLRALVAARLGRQADARSLEGALGYGIASAYLGQNNASNDILGWAVRTYGLGTSVSWALGWALGMQENWPAAEAYLLDAAARCPEQATIRSLLGTCQWQIGKLHEAAQSVRTAISLEPAEPRHRVLLGQLLLASGRPREALQSLEAAEAAGIVDLPLLMGTVRANLLLGREAEAARRSAQAEEAHPGSETLLRLGHAYVEAREYEPAWRYFETVRAHGFYPDALVGLGRIAHERKQLLEARASLLAALDCTRPVAEGGRGPLELLSSVAAGLRGISNADAVDCKAWTALLELSGAPAVKACRLSLLVCAATAEEARELALQIYRAMRPDREADEPAVLLQPEAADKQPQVPVVPGIYGHRVE